MANTENTTPDLNKYKYQMITQYTEKNARDLLTSHYKTGLSYDAIVNLALTNYFLVNNHV